MAYIGKQPLVGNFTLLDSITATTTDTYALTKDSVAVFPQTPANCIVSLNGVIQAPTDSYTISGSDIVFASALTASDSIDFITVLGDVLNIGTPSDNTVSLAKLTATGTKDATTFLRGDNTFQTIGTNTPAFSAFLTDSQTLTTNTWTKLSLDDEQWDTNSAFDSTTNYRFTVPSGEGGKYLFTYASGTEGTNSTAIVQTALYKNGSSLDSSITRSYPNQVTGGYPHKAIVLDLSAGDYIESFGQHTKGSDCNFDPRYTFLQAQKLIGV